MAKSKKGSSSKASDPRLFTLDVSLLSGPVTEEFVADNPIVTRTIQIRADQTLEMLHGAIFDAFGRDDEHLYEFQVGGKAPMDPDAKRYGLAMARQGIFGDSEQAGNVEDTTVGMVGFAVGDLFAYWFDFGDDWWHQVSVVDIKDKAPEGKFPKVTKSVGANPPQYPGMEDEEFDEDEDFEDEDEDEDDEDFDEDEEEGDDEEMEETEEDKED